jgi:hypothetical protein
VGQAGQVRFVRFLGYVTAPGIVLCQFLGCIAWCRPVGCPPMAPRWIKPRYDFFLPVEVLGAIFRGKFHESLGLVC